MRFPTKSVHEALDALQPLRVEKNAADLANTAVVTFAATLDEALDVYGPQIRKLSSSACFLLADWSNFSESACGAAKNRKVRILPLKAYGSCGKAGLCVYTKPDAMQWWSYGHYGEMVSILTGMGIAAFEVDAAVLRPLRRNPMYDPVAAREYFTAHEKELHTVYQALEGEESREVFLRAVKARITGISGYARVSWYSEYCHPLVRACLGNVVCDGGLYQGHSLALHAWRAGPEGRAIGFEPQPDNAASVALTMRPFPNTTVETLGLWSGEAEMYIGRHASSGGKMNREQAPGSHACRAVSLDAWLAGGRCDLLSLDVEGAETDILKGAMETIRRHRPKLQISIYHNPAHYLEIPLMLLREELGYHFYVGHHSAWFEETVLYATTQPPWQAREEGRFTDSFALSAWSGVQAEAESEARRAAETLAGREVLFWGAGAAYEYYKGLFSGVRPRAIVVDERWPSGPGDGIPVRSFAELEEADKALPVIAFSRLEYSHAMRNSIRLHYGSSGMPLLFACVLCQ